VRGRRALVTGAAGFIGANLVRRLLADGAEVHALIRPSGSSWRLDGVGGDVRRHDADLADAAALRGVVRSARPDVVFHLAAHGAYSWQRDLAAMTRVNVLGTEALLEAARDAGVERVVHAGTSSEYGETDHAPAEDERLEPNSHYAVTKAAATHLCALVAGGGLTVATLRLYSAYGPWEEPGRLMPTVVMRGLAGELPPLVDPRTPRDLVFVDDVCDAFVRAATAAVPAAHRIYNVGSGRQATIGEIVALVRERLAIEAEPEWGSYAPRDWDTAVWVAQPRRAATELGWSATTSLRAGIDRTVDWFGRSDRPDVYAA
jgi:dolichol-phosphate mannosyltransferase